MARQSINGKRVLITGAARGIGAETARALARKGARLALIGLEPELLDKVARDCGSNAFAIEADVSDRDSTERAVNEAAERMGGIDILMANAGIAAAGSVRTIDPDAFDRTIEVNLLGVWRTVRAGLPYVIESKGYILNIASVAAILHAPLMSAYAASKAGTEAFSNSLRLEVEHLGVDVGVAYFLWIDTDMVRDADAKPIFSKFRKSLKGPAGKTLPVSRAIDAIVKGIENREDRIFAPGAMKAVQRLRGFPGVFSRDAQKAAPYLVREAEAQVAEEGAKKFSLTDRVRATDPKVGS